MNSLSELVANVSRKEVPAHAKNLILEITAEDTTEEDVEVPYVKVRLNK